MSWSWVPFFVIKGKFWGHLVIIRGMLGFALFRQQAHWVVLWVDLLPANFKWSYMASCLLLWIFLGTLLLCLLKVLSKYLQFFILFPLFDGLSGFILAEAEQATKLLVWVNVSLFNSFFPDLFESLIFLVLSDEIIKLQELPIGKELTQSTFVIDVYKLFVLAIIFIIVKWFILLI